jgi:hypothetical protein
MIKIKIKEKDKFEKTFAIFKKATSFYLKKYREKLYFSKKKPRKR